MEVGKLLGNRYKVVQKIGAGSFGETYLAEDKHKMEAICVVKHLHPNNTDPSFLEIARDLFNREGKTLHALVHPQIPQLLAFFEENAEFYLVQDYVAGHPLSGEFPPEMPTWTESKVVQLLQDVLTVLEYVHDRGIIHRDIKPDNLMRRQKDDKIVLIDFGVAKLRQDFSEVDEKGKKQGTIVGSVGTYGYFPTEQALGNPQPNSDIYALGMVAIEALTGIHPQDLKQNEMGEFVWQPPNPVSPKLIEILSKMVRYDHRQRHQTATDVLEALQALQPKPPRNWKLIGTVAVSTIASISLLGIGISKIWPKPNVPSSPSESSVQKPLESPEQTADTFRALQQALAQKDYRKADNLTYQLMLGIAGSISKAQGRFDEQEWKQFPCSDLKEIDRLWSEATEGTQGFSAQKHVMSESNNNPQQFHVRVAWRDDTNKWLVLPQYSVIHTTVSYANGKEPNFSNPPRGHLPVKLAWDDTKDNRFERIYECKL